MVREGAGCGTRVDSAGISNNFLHDFGTEIEGRDKEFHRSSGQRHGFLVSGNVNLMDPFISAKLLKPVLSNLHICLF